MPVNTLLNNLTVPCRSLIFIMNFFLYLKWNEKFSVITVIHINKIQTLWASHLSFRNVVYHCICLMSSGRKTCSQNRINYIHPIQLHSEHSSNNEKMISSEDSNCVKTIKSLYIWIYGIIIILYHPCALKLKEMKTRLHRSSLALCFQSKTRRLYVWDVLNHLSAHPNHV